MTRSNNSKKALFIYWANQKVAPTVTEQIRQITSLPEIEFDLMNLYFEQPILRNPILKLKSFFLQKRSIADYDYILFHNSSSYDIDYLTRSFHRFQELLQNSKAKKILFKQDEMIDVYKVQNFIKKYNVTALLTCIPPQEIPKVYPRQHFPHLQFYHIITGYLTDELIYRKNKPYESRTTDISYRGMDTPPEWGRLSYEKLEIAEEFNRKAREQGVTLRLDISANRKKRFSGKAWYSFLEDSKASLAVESGASIFDFDGSIKRLCRAYKKQYPNATFEDYEKNVLNKFEGNVYYNQVSPRHLEAAALETGLIMYEGTYSDIFKPYTNFIPLKKDFSNFLDVLAQFKDSSFMKSLIATNKLMVQERDDLHSKEFLKIVSKAIND